MAKRLAVKILADWLGVLVFFPLVTGHPLSGLVRVQPVTSAKSITCVAKGSNPSLHYTKDGKPCRESKQ
jgi:hypothetical protein